MQDRTLRVICILAAGISALAEGAAELAPPVAGAAPAANAGITMAYYRNFFSGSMNHLKQIDMDGEAPFKTIPLPDFQARSPWNERNTRNLGRLYGLVIHGWIVPDVSGEYVLSAQCNGTMALHLSTDSDEANARPITIERMKPGGETEKKPGHPAYAPNLIASEAVTLKAEERYFVKVYFLPGWQDSLRVGWKLKNRPGTHRIIPRENLNRASK